MARLQISAEAELDLNQIVLHTISVWGERQTGIYLSKLENGFDMLAKNPSAGRPCDAIHTGLRRFEIGWHVVFYLFHTDEVFVVRILHRQMLPANYL